MKFSEILAPIAGLAAVATATPWGKTGDSYYTTVVTTDYVTYCPVPTTFAYYNVTYTATTPCSITITNCPCTLSVSTPPPVTTTSLCSGYLNSTSSYTTVTYTPSPSTYLTGVTPVTSTTSASKTPIKPTVSPTITPVVTAGAAKFAPAGALFAAGLAALAL